MEIMLSQLTQGFAEIKKDCLITSVVTDSRRAKENSVFLAIRGERVNGEDYAAKAVSQGARFVVTENYIPDVPADMQAVVPNVLDASIQMGHNVRDTFDLQVVGVTGSVGKTTTKDFVYCALAPFVKTVKSEGNHNNELGMPRTIYTFTKEDKMAVLEMGMEKFGDVHKLSVAAHPVAAVITGFGITHLERMKTRENILKAKLEICDGMPEDGVLVLNGDDDYLPSAQVTRPKNVVYFAINNKSADIVAENITQQGRSTSFTINDKKYGQFTCTIPTVGSHNVMDAMSAYGVATRLGYDPRRVCKNLSTYQVSGMRQKFVEKGDYLFIEDCYNAAPDSMRAAIDTLKTVSKGRTIAVLGDMLELGDDSPAHHYNVGKYAAEKGVDCMWTFGERAKQICAGYSEGAINFASKEQLAQHIVNNLNKDDTIIFKASNSMRFAEIIEQVYKAL